MYYLITWTYDRDYLNTSLDCQMHEVEEFGYTKLQIISDSNDQKDNVNGQPLKTME
jgi:hypothetical protein